MDDLQVPKLGEIRQGFKIGKLPATTKFIFHACVVCGKRRWITIMRAKSARIRCNVCSGKAREKIHCSLNINEPPILGEIREAKDIGKKGTNKYIWTVCDDCGIEWWVKLLAGKPRSTRCRLCWQKKIAKERRVKPRTYDKPPILDEIRYGCEIGREKYRNIKFVWVACSECQKPRWLELRTKPRQYICKECNSSMSKARFASTQKELNFMWKGGRVERKTGYVRIRLYPGDPFYQMANPDKYVWEHRLVMAQHLGRCLEHWELVHHLNGIRDDNRLENLAIVTAQTHETYTVKRLLETHIKELESNIKDLQSRVTLLEAENVLLKTQLDGNPHFTLS